MAKTRNVVKNPLHLLSILKDGLNETSAAIENATRLGDFKKGFKKGDAKKAAFDSREVTLDFAKIGAKTQSINMIVAFWNAQVQGLSRIEQAFREDMIGTSAKMMASVTLPSIALWALNHNDDRYKELPRWQKDLFWIVMTDEHVFRIPKPFEPGLIFGSLIERTLDKFIDDNPDAGKNFAQTLLQAFAPSVVPTAVLPFIETYANKSTFTGMPIIPYDKESLVPELQHSDYTTETAKKLASAIGIIPLAGDSAAASPAVVEHFINAWSGNSGRYVLSIADSALEALGITAGKNRSSTPLESKPVIKSFMIRYPSAQSQSIQDFYENFRNAAKVHASLKEFFDEGLTDRAKEFRAQNMDAVRTYAFLNTAKKALSNMRKTIDAIEENRKYKPDEKRQLIDQIYSRMIKSAALANKRTDELKKMKIVDPDEESN